MKMKKSIWTISLLAFFALSGLFGQIDVDVLSAVNGEANGKITVAVTGNSGPFRLSLSGDGLTEPLTKFVDGEGGGMRVFSNLPSGSYRLFVSDITDCTESVDILIEDGGEFECAIDLVISHLQHIQDCYDENCEGQIEGCHGFGKISLDVNPEDVNITWTLNEEPFDAPDVLNLEGLDAGIYTVRVEDNERPELCYIEKTIEIDVCHDHNGNCEERKNNHITVVRHTFPQVNGSTNGTDGSIYYDFEFESTTDVIYYWESEDGTRYPSLNVTGLAPGTYCFKLFDGCDFIDKSYVTGCVTVLDCSFLNHLAVEIREDHNVYIGTPDDRIDIQIVRNSNSSGCVIESLRYAINDDGLGSDLSSGLSITIKNVREEFVEEISSSDFNGIGNEVLQATNFLNPTDISHLPTDYYMITIETEEGCTKTLDLDLRPPGMPIETDGLVIYHELNPDGSDGHYKEDIFEENRPPFFYNVTFGAYVCDNTCVADCPSWEYIEFEYEPDDWETPCAGGILKYVKSNGTSYFVIDDEMPGFRGKLVVVATLFNVEPQTLSNCENSVTCIWDFKRFEDASFAYDRIAATFCRDHLKPDEIPDDNPSGDDPAEDCPDPGIDIFAYVNDDDPCQIIIEIFTDCDVSGELRVSDNLGSRWRGLSGIVNLEEGRPNIFTARIKSYLNDANIRFEVEINNEIWSYTLYGGFGCLIGINDQEDLAQVSLKQTASGELSKSVTKNLHSSSDLSPFQESITYFPNPFTQDITIRIQTLENKELNILITDLVGKKVYQQAVAVTEGVNDIVVKQLRLAAEGVYLVTVTNKDMDLVEGFKIIKAH